MTDDEQRNGPDDDAPATDDAPAAEDGANAHTAGESTEPDEENAGPDEDVLRPAEQQQAPRRPARVAGALIGVLVALLGFAIAVQVHANSQSDSLAGLREDDLVGILDNQTARADRLRQQISQLHTELDKLQNSGDAAAAARQQAEQEYRALGVLLGTLPATGPGVIVQINDPNHKLQAEDLLDVIEELRGAGAEAIAFGPVRVTTTTAFAESDGSVTVDGSTLSPPYVVTAIGAPKTLNTALNIPGGVAATIRTEGATLTVSEHASVRITVVTTLRAPKYAKPDRH